jgi:antitoxin MazE
MNTHIIKIGNSWGIRIPKAFLDQTGLKGEVMVSVVGDSLVINPVHAARAGWDEAFASMAAAGDDVLDGDAVTGEAIAHSFDDEEWEWK